MEDFIIAIQAAEDVHVRHLEILSQKFLGQYNDNSTYGFPSLSSTTPLGSEEEEEVELEEESCPKLLKMFAACLVCDFDCSEELDDSSSKLGILFDVPNYRDNDAQGLSIFAMLGPLVIRTFADD